MLAEWPGLALLGLLPACRSAPPPSAPTKAELSRPAPPEISAAALEADVGFLADDAQEGRATGSPGGVRAGEFLAGRLAAAGLEPAGDDGSYLQRVPFGTREYTALPEMWVASDAGVERATYGVDFDGVGGLPVDATLSLVVCRSAEDVPDPDAGVALYLAGNSRERAAWLGDREGYGLLLWSGSRRAGAEPSTRPPRTRHWVGEAPDRTPTARVRGPLAERFEAGELRTVRLAAPAADRTPPAFNVVGRLPGSGVLAGEVVVYSAHYDHLGVKQPAPEDEPDADRIFNGADDDASGCAAVVELARALAAEARAADPAAHRRTQVFLLVTGEELGLLGTEYYLEHPAEPLEATICNLNFEMIGRPDALVGGAGRLWLTGFELTNLGEAWRDEGIEVAADPRPEQHFFHRSDNYAFAERGIVAQTLSTYDLHTDYHHVTDELSTLDFAHMERCMGTALEAARALADGRIWPAWKPGGDPSRN